MRWFTGHLVEIDRITLYYGASDMVIGAATLSIGAALMRLSAGRAPPRPWRMRPWSGASFSRAPRVGGCRAPEGGTLSAVRADVGIRRYWIRREGADAGICGLLG